MMKDNNGLVVLWILALALAAQSAGAEVMDKEPSLRTIWFWAATGTIAGLLACRWRASVAIITLPVTLAVPVATILELRDPYVGKDIIAEAGKAYGVTVYAAALLVVLAHTVGVASRVRRTRRREQRTKGFSGPI